MLIIMNIKQFFPENLINKQYSTYFQIIVFHIYKMILFLLLSLFLLSTIAENIPIRSIQIHNSDPYILIKSSNKCRQVNLNMSVSCIPTTYDLTSRITVANLYYNHNNTNTHIQRLYSKDWHIIDGLMTSNYDYYDTIYILNNTKIEIVKGYHCMNRPLNIKIYRMDFSDVAKCWNSLDQKQNQEIGVVLFFVSLISFIIIGMASVYK